MSEADQFNALLNEVGSEYRVSPGEVVTHGIRALLEALPSYIDRMVAEAMKRAASK